MAEQDPDNAGWLRELAVAHGNVGAVLEVQGKLAEALLRSEEAARIFGRLAELAPGFAQWAMDKESVEQELARCRMWVAAAPPTSSSAGK